MEPRCCFERSPLRLPLFSTSVPTTSPLSATPSWRRTGAANDTINLAAASTYTLTTQLFTTTGFSGLARIESDGGRALIINGLGATIQRSTAGGTPDFRIFDIASGANVTFNNVTIKNGKAAPVGGGGPQYDEGGGICNRQGSLTVQNCTFESNSGRIGGGIHSYLGTVTSDFAKLKDACL